MKDAIRRRGENISSFEVEAEVRAHPKVRETAVVGVPSEFGEDEVMAIVAPVPGAKSIPWNSSPSSRRACHISWCRGYPLR